MVQPNLLAYVMLLIWPVVAWQLYRRLDPARALIWTILAGYLVLPPVAAINFPVVPDLTKDSAPNVMALLLSIYLLKDRISIMPDSVVGRVLIGLFVLSPFATVLANDDPIRFVQSELQGMRIYDSVAAVANHAIYLLPFFLARRYLASPQAMQTLLAALVVAGLAYSVPMLIEMRLSPQMNVWVYGFFQHDFSQTIRFGGFRPVVFLPHGLWVAFFALMAVLAAALAFRVGPADRRPVQLLVLVFLVLLLVMCRSAGPLVYAVTLVPVILLMPGRGQLILAAVMALMVVTYPLLRGAHIVPVAQIVALAEQVSPERASSLQFRIENEEQLLARAAERPLFGWGGYGRNLIRDPITGREASIADGAWIIQIGIYGWLGYIAEFGLLALPLLALGREALAQRRAAFSPHACAVALILAANMVDMLPNGTLIPFTWLMAGALLGHAEALARARRKSNAIDWANSLDPRPSRTVI